MMILLRLKSNKLFSCYVDAPLILKEYLAQYLFWPENSVYNKKSTSLSPCYGIHWSYYISHHPKIAGLTEQWNGLLKSQL